VGLFTPAQPAATNPQKISRLNKGARWMRNRGNRRITRMATVENMIICPNCGKTLPNSELIEDAIKGEGAVKRSTTCVCGERITYWNIKAQLREHQTMGWKFRNWVRSLTQRKEVQ